MAWEVVPVDGPNQKSIISNKNGETITYRDLADNMDASFGVCDSPAKVGHREAQTYCDRLNQMGFTK